MREEWGENIARIKVGRSLAWEGRTSEDGREKISKVKICRNPVWEALKSRASQSVFWQGVRFPQGFSDIPKLLGTGDVSLDCQPPRKAKHTTRGSCDLSWSNPGFATSSAGNKVQGRDKPSVPLSLVSFSLLQDSIKLLIFLLAWTLSWLLYCSFVITKRTREKH